MHPRYAHPIMPKRSFKHVDWQALRQLIAKGVSLKQLSTTFDIKYQTLLSRSYRERWNVAAIRANLPPKSRAEIQRKDSCPDARLLALRNGVTLPLVKLANFYQSADVDLLRKDSTRFMAFVHASLKLLSLNDAKQAEGNTKQLNLAVLALKPEAMAKVTREIQAAVQSTDSASSGAEPQVVENQGTPTSRSEKKVDPAMP